MKKLYILFIAIITTTLSFGQILNEFEPNPSGTDPNPATFEIKGGTPGTFFSAWILSIECDSSAPVGLVESAFVVTGIFDFFGILEVTGPDLENPSFTIILVDNFTGAVGVTDIDGNNDGVADDTSSWSFTYDAIGIPDNIGDESFLYATELGGTDFKYTNDEPGLVFRDGISGDLYAVNEEGLGAANVIYDTIGNIVANGDFDVNPAAGNTFGSVNPSRLVASTKETHIDGFSFSPNPTGLGHVNISSRSQTPMKVNVFDALGKEVIDVTVTNCRLDVSRLNAGVFIMKVSQDDVITTKKLVIK